MFTFPADNPVKLTALVRGSDGAPYVLDEANKTVWRIDLAKKTATAIAKSGQRASGARVADPKILVTGGPDVLVLDAQEQPLALAPRRTTRARGRWSRIRIPDAGTWGNDIDVMSTFVANFDAAFYKLYLVDPSEQNIMVLSPANDGSGYPLKPTDRLPTDRPVDGITDLLIDGDIFVAENGGVARVIPASNWKADAPEDAQVRPDPDYTLLAVARSARRRLDQADRRAVRVRPQQPPDRGVRQGERRLRGAVPARGVDPAWADLRDFVVLPGADDDAPVDGVVDLRRRAAQRGARAGRGPARRRPPARRAASAPAKSPKPKPTKTPRP